MELSGKQRRHLRALGHHLKPVVFVGLQDLSDALVDKVDEELGHHELIKVKVSGDCLESPKEAGELLSKSCDASLVQVIGRTVLLYRAHPDEPAITLP